MGNSGSKKLSKEDMAFLIENTNFTRSQIKAWYKGFMVSYIPVYYFVLLQAVRLTYFAIYVEINKPHL